MADEPISALTLLSSYSTADEVEILDVSDTTFASTGTNKRIQFSTLLTMAGVGTAAGVATVAGGGTGLTAVGSADQLLGVAHTGGALEYKTLTAGANVTITPAAGSITIASTGGSGSGLASGEAISGGTSNGVLYETSSSTLRIGSTVLCNGTQLGIGAIDTSYGSPLMIYGAAGTPQWITVQVGSSPYGPSHGTNVLNFGIAGANAQFGSTVKAGDAVYKFADGADMRIVTNSYELVHFSTVSPAPMIGFFNTTAVVQPTAHGTSSGFAAGSGTGMTSTSTSTGGTGSSAYTFDDLVLAFKQLGLLAS